MMRDGGEVISGSLVDFGFTCFEMSERVDEDDVDEDDVDDDDDGNDDANDSEDDDDEEAGCSL